MSKNKVIKSVSFNITNERDLQFLERIENVNFSGYVKQLIEKDIRQRKLIKAETRPAQCIAGGHTRNGPIITKGTSLTLISE